jgi:hypothetical protein
MRLTVERYRFALWRTWHDAGVSQGGAEEKHNHHCPNPRQDQRDGRRKLVPKKGGPATLMRPEMKGDKVFEETGQQRLECLPHTHSIT